MNEATNFRVPIIGFSEIYDFVKPEFLTRMKRRIEAGLAPLIYGDFRNMLYAAFDGKCVSPSGMWFEAYDLRDKDMPEHGGVYFCERCICGSEFDDDSFLCEICYVGKTNNLKSRFQNHHKMPAFDFLNVNNILFLAMPDYSQTDILWAERQYINLLRPLLNDRNSCTLMAGSTEDVKRIAMENYRQIWDQAFDEGLKVGFNSAKSQMTDFFVSAIQMP